MTNQVTVTQEDIAAARSIWHRCDDGPYCELPQWLVQAFARHRILATRTDATPVAVEMVAELQLSAFLAGRGSIRTKANGNTHESSPGPTMDDYRRMARFALAEGQVDATPVAEAWEVFEAAMKDPGYAWGWHCNLAVPIMDATGITHKQANMAAAHLMQHLWKCDITTHPNYQYEKSGAQAYAEFRIEADKAEGAALPDAAHPPATDVAALVEALEEIRDLQGEINPSNYDHDDVCELNRQFCYAFTIADAALAPFTKGQNDE